MASAVAKCCILSLVGADASPVADAVLLWKLLPKLAVSNVLPDT